LTAAFLRKHRKYGTYAVQEEKQLMVRARVRKRMTLSEEQEKKVSDRQVYK
jgi:hypothetical protein